MYFSLINGGVFYARSVLHFALNLVSDLLILKKKEPLLGAQSPVSLNTSPVNHRIQPVIMNVQSSITNVAAASAKMKLQASINIDTKKLMLAIVHITLLLVIVYSS